MKSWMIGKTFIKYTSWFGAMLQCSDVNNGRSSDMSDRFETLVGQIKAKTREMSEQNN